MLAFEKESQEEQEATLCRGGFTFNFPIGKGGFGKVWHVQHKKSKQFLALKEMNKGRIISKRSVSSVQNERKILASLRHPFIVNMQYAFQDRENLYLAMDLMPGGDLRYHLSKLRRFSEEQTRFFIACILSGLEYLHGNGVLHRDLKPENLVLDDNGYVHITDFGIARVWRPENSHDTSGTPGYMAPEVLCHKNHTIAVDYFALGVMTYEFMQGRRPYLGKSRKEIRDAVMAKQVLVHRQELPQGWSLEAADFVNKLIQRKPGNRLGVNGPEEVKSHPWFSPIKWRALYEKTVPAPFRPSPGDNFDARIATQDWKDEEAVQAALRLEDTPGLFDGYCFENVQVFRPPTASKVTIYKLKPKA